MKLQSGVALIQVLIISLVLTILSLFILQSVKRQVGVSEMVKANFSLRLEIENAEAELLKTLVEFRPYRNDNSDNDIVKVWNFYNKPFSIGKGVIVQIQDVRGLVNLNYINERLLINTLKGLEVKGKDLRVLVDSLQDWVDNDDLKRINGAEKQYYESLNKVAPRNNILTSTLELKSVRGSQVLADKKLDNYFTVLSQIGFNPMNAPELVLKAFLGDVRLANQIIALRNDKQLTEQKFKSMSGVQSDEYINFATGGYLKVQLSIDRRGIALKKAFSIRLKPASITSPVIISNVIWN